jgi:hypothetical protein
MSKYGGAGSGAVSFWWSRKIMMSNIGELSKMSQTVTVSYNFPTQFLCHFKSEEIRRRKNCSTYPCVNFTPHQIFARSWIRTKIVRLRNTVFNTKM